ncbi:MAG TPA: plastocyanin/azurin family copper-binding protein [Solirubrobacterales bacterium]|nr:plastocyanin/azurin family copper-binding protein [Solirubrobacterales bacterium]
MDSDLFWFFAGALVLAAVVLAFIGLRSKGRWPTSSRPVAIGIAIFAALVVATGAFAIAYAEDEQEHRDAELAAEEAEAQRLEQEQGDEGASPSAQQTTGASEGGQPGGAPEAGAAATLDVSSPADGSLVYEPSGLEAGAGNITLAYDNPSAVPHNINLEVEGETIAESESLTNGSTEISAELAPGEYLFYCSIPGHRQAGMEGTLTVD